MKGEHLAKADFLKELRQLTRELYELENNVSAANQSLLLKSKINGFIDAGRLLEVAGVAEMQAVIDDCHIETFSETRKERRERLAKSFLPAFESPETTSAWEIYDSPSFERRNKRKGSD